MPNVGHCPRVRALRTVWRILDKSLIEVPKLASGERGKVFAWAKRVSRHCWCKRVAMCTAHAHATALLAAAALLGALGALTTPATASELLMRKAYVPLDVAARYGAACLDGSPPSYYVRHARCDLSFWRQHARLGYQSLGARGPLRSHVTSARARATRCGKAKQS